VVVPRASQGTRRLQGAWRGDQGWGKGVGLKGFRGATLLATGHLPTALHHDSSSRFGDKVAKRPQGLKFFLKWGRQALSNRALCVGYFWEQCSGGGRYSVQMSHRGGPRGAERVAEAPRRLWVGHREGALWQPIL
jgi:hypothetical protein